jgi:hypothetical protein
VDVQSAEPPELPPLFWRTEHFFDRDLDAADCRKLAGVPVDPLSCSSGRGGFYRPGADLLVRAVGRSFGGQVESPAHSFIAVRRK